MKIKYLLAILFVFSLNNGVCQPQSEDDDTGWSFEDSPIYEDELEDIYDPLEPFNRLMFGVNNAIDKVFVTPLAMTYKHILPKFLQIAVENFASNFFAPVRTVNFILQKDAENATKTVWRFMINTVFGFFGTGDVAAKLGITKKDTNLGDTLKKWGARPGPYIVLPLFGPTSFRGAVGKGFQSAVDPIAQVSLLRYKKNTRNRLYYTIYGADLLAKRSALLGIMKELEKTSEDMYVTTRKAVMASES